MSRRPSRLRTGGKVVVNCDNLGELLSDFALVDADGRPLKGIRMIGEVKKNSKTHSSCFLQAADESFHIPHDKVDSCTENVSAPVYYVVVAEKIIEVEGLLLPDGMQVEGYHLDRASAAKELVASQPKKTAEPATAAAAVATAPMPPLPSPTPPPNATATTTTRTASTPPNRRRRRRPLVDYSEEKATESKIPGPPSSEESVDESEQEGASADDDANLTPNECEVCINYVLILITTVYPVFFWQDDASEEEPALIEVVEPPVDVGVPGADADDFLTDDSSETESSHDEEDLRWKKPKDWTTKVRNKPLLKKMGDLVWKAHKKRGSVSSLDVGLDTRPEFEIKAGDKFLDLLFDALPRRAFFRDILVRESKRYAASKTEDFSPQARAIPPKLITVANFLRLFACVILRGLVRSKDDATFFRTERHKGYVRTGAEEMTGLTMTQYQQLLRFMHLVDNEKKTRPRDKHHDKCFHVRPLIQLLQSAFKRWFFPGRDNAVDEAGFPSRHHWLRSYNQSKPHKYFIEVLMAACSKTRFVWSFFVNESSKKMVTRSRRRPRQSKFKKVRHFQQEFNENERVVQVKYGATAAQMVHFARKLREYDPKDHSDQYASIYRLFTDRRWDNLVGVVLARKNHGVSYTATVKSGHRFHVAWQFKKTKTIAGLVKSKKMSIRGKYRTATTTINGVRLATVLWVDSSLVAVVSADLGSEAKKVGRRRGRHGGNVDCPLMVFVRGEKFRAVDINDQLRLGKVHFAFSCKRKAWPKLFFGLIELTLVNMYIVVVWTHPAHKDMTQEFFRWKIVEELVDEAKRLDAEAAARARGEQTEDADDVAEPQTLTPLQIREQGRGGSHHHDIQPEYVSEAVAAENQKVVDADPCARPTKRKKCRERDRKRTDGKVLNPLLTSLSPCIVCKFFFRKKKPTKTSRYCRECMTDPAWPETTRAKG